MSHAPMLYDELSAMENLTYFFLRGCIGMQSALALVIRRWR